MTSTVTGAGPAADSDASPPTEPGRPADQLDVAADRAPEVQPGPAERPRLAGLPAAWAVAARAVCLLAVLLLGFPAYLLGLSALREARDQDTLYATLRGELTRAIAPVAGPIAEGRPVAVLAVPRLGIRDVVVEGTSSGVLVSGPGHRRDTPLPGQAGASVIAGRRTTQGSPFARLGALAPGDTVLTTTGQGTATYTVLQLRYSGRLTPTLQLPPDRLLLVTSDPVLHPDRALVVVAGLQTPVAAGGPARVQLRPEERTLVGDTGALVPLVLWGQVLLLTMAGTAWLYVRWGRSSAWLATTPVVLAVTWNVYETVARLLPNTF